MMNENFVRILSAVCNVCQFRGNGENNSEKKHFNELNPIEPCENNVFYYHSFEFRPFRPRMRRTFICFNNTFIQYSHITMSVPMSSNKNNLIILLKGHFQWNFRSADFSHHLIELWSVWRRSKKQRKNIRKKNTSKIRFCIRTSTIAPKWNYTVAMKYV